MDATCMTSLLTAAVAVVGRAEYGDHVLLMRPVVPLHDELMRPRDRIQPIGVVELLRNVLSKRVASASWRDTPAASVIRIRP
jgi:hypothetical protein